LILQGLQTAAQFIAVGGMDLVEPVLDRYSFGRQAKTAHQRRRQLHFGAVAGHFPPATAEQRLQNFQSLQLLMMAMLSQAFEQGRGDGSGQQQPVVIAQVRRLLLSVIACAQQPRRHALGIAVGHGKACVWAEQRAQARLFAGQQTLRQSTVQAVERGAQGLLFTPQLR